MQIYGDFEGFPPLIVHCLGCFQEFSNIRLEHTKTTPQPTLFVSEFRNHLVAWGSRLGMRLSGYVGVPLDWCFS